MKAVKIDNKQVTAFLKAYASGLITLPERVCYIHFMDNYMQHGKH